MKVRNVAVYPDNYGPEDLFADLVSLHELIEDPDEGLSAADTCEFLYVILGKLRLEVS